jgi:hypothetical protein
MVLINRSEVCKISLEVYLLFKIHFSIKFFQNGVRLGALCTGFPLGGGFAAEQFAPAWWYETAGGEERLLRWTAQQNEAPPADSNACWRRVFWRELLRWYSEFRREGNFPERKLSGFRSGGIRNMQSTSGNRFFCSCVILFTQSTMWVLCLVHFSISLT